MQGQQTIGSRSQVMHGTALKTSGGLRAGDLKYSSSGRIVSKKASARAKKENRLKGYLGKSPNNPLRRMGLI